jgi:hypothetical protein
MSAATFQNRVIQGTAKMKIFQLFDLQENTYYVEASCGKIAQDFVEEQFQTRVETWHPLTFTPHNVEIHLAYERKTNAPAIS